jgi:hypothetical protein
MTHLTDAANLLRTAVDNTIEALDLGEQDAAAVRLARHYANLIDAQEDPKLTAWALRWIGPLLLDVLESLGATPAARDRLKNGGGNAAHENQLAKFRQARRA